MFLTILIPVYNEAENLMAFYKELSRVLLDNRYDANILFIDDGSIDNSLDILQTLAEKDEKVGYVALSRNFGKEAAMTAGIDYATGDAAIIMDADLQHPPNQIPAFVEKWKEGFDVVYGIREKWKDEPMMKQLFSTCFYKIFNRLSNIPLPPGSGDFRLIDKKVINALRLLPERERFMKGLYTWVGFNSYGMSYVARPRIRGAPKWGNRRLWGFALTGIVSFSAAPLRVWSLIGMFVALCGFTYGSVIVISWLIYGTDLPGYSTIVTLILFLGGIQLISIGVLGEYFSKAYTELKQRPIYLIKEVGGLPPNQQNS